MLETSPKISLLAIAVVGMLLSLLVWFLVRAIATSNLFKKGFNLYQQKDYSGAEEVFRQVIERHRSNDMAHLLLGDALIEQDRLNEAIPVFQELLERSPKNIDAYLSLGKALMRQGKPNEAITQFKEATRKLPKVPEGYRFLGLALSSQGFSEEAIVALTKARDIYKKKANQHMVEVTNQDLQQLDV